MSKILPKDAVLAAFTQVARAERNNVPVIFSKLGLSTSSTTAFKKAITTTYTKEKDGFDLQAIFSIKGNFLHRRNTPLNPKDGSLIDLIMKAMTYNRQNPSHRPKPTLTTEELVLQLKARGYEVNLRVL